MRAWKNSEGSDARKASRHVLPYLLPVATETRGADRVCWCVPSAGGQRFAQCEEGQGDTADQSEQGLFCIAVFVWVSMRVQVSGVLLVEL